MDNSDTVHAAGRVTRAQKKRLMSVESEYISSHPNTPSKVAPSMERELVTQSARTTRRNSMSTPTKSKPSMRSETPDLNSPRRILTRRRSLSITENSPACSKIGKEPQFDALPEEPTVPNSPGIQKISPSVEKRVTRSQSGTPPQKETFEAHLESPQNQLHQSGRSRRIRRSADRGSTTKQNKSDLESSHENSKTGRRTISVDSDVEMIDLEQLDKEKEKEKLQNTVEVERNISSKNDTSDDVSGHDGIASVTDVENVSGKENVKNSVSIKATDTSEKYDKTKSVAFNVSGSKDDTMGKTLPKTPGLTKSKSNILRESAISQDSFSGEILQVEEEQVKNVPKRSNESLLMENSPYKLKTLKVLLCSTPVAERLAQQLKKNESQMDISALEVSSGCTESKQNLSSLKTATDRSGIHEKDNSDDKAPAKDLSSKDKPTDQSGTCSIAPPDTIDEPAETQKLEFSKSWSQNVRRQTTGDDKIDPIEENNDHLKDHNEKHKENSDIVPSTKDAKNESMQQANTDSDEEPPKEFESLYVEDEASVASENYRSGDSLCEEDRLEMEMNDIVEDGESIGSKDTDEECENTSESSEKDSFIVSDPTGSSQNLSGENSVDLGFDFERERKISQQISDYISSDMNSSRLNRSNENKKAQDMKNRPFAADVSRMIDDDIQCANATRKSLNKSLNSNPSNRSKQNLELDSSSSKMEQDEESNTSLLQSSSHLNENQKTDSASKGSAQPTAINSATKSTKRISVMVISSSDQESVDSVTAVSKRKRSSFKTLRLEKVITCESSDESDASLVPLKKPPNIEHRRKVVPTSSDSEFERTEHHENSTNKNDISHEELDSNSKKQNEIENVQSTSKQINAADPTEDSLLENYNGTQETSSNNSSIAFEKCNEQVSSHFDGQFNMQKSHLSVSFPSHGNVENQKTNPTKILHHSFSINLSFDKNPPPEVIDHFRTKKLEVHTNSKTSVANDDLNDVSNNEDSTNNHNESNDSLLKNMGTDNNIVLGSHKNNRHSFNIAQPVEKKTSTLKKHQRKSLNQTASQSELSESFISHLTKERLAKLQNNAMVNESLNNSKVEDTLKDHAETTGVQQNIEKPTSSMQVEEDINDSNNNLPKTSEEQVHDEDDCEDINSKDESRDSDQLNSEDNSGLDSGKNLSADVSLDSTIESNVESQSDSKSILDSTSSKESSEKLTLQLKSSIDSDSASDSDSEDHEEEEEEQEKEKEKKEEKYNIHRIEAIKHALQASKKLLLQSEEPRIGRISSDPSKRLPSEFIEELISLESTDSTPRSPSQPIEEFESKLGTVTVYPITPPLKNYTLGYMHESPVTPRLSTCKVRNINMEPNSLVTCSQETQSRKRKRGNDGGTLNPPKVKKPLEVLKSKLGIVKVYPTSPPPKNCTLGNIRESPVTPYSTAFKVRKLNSYQDIPPVGYENKKSRKKNRLIIKEPTFALPQPKWISRNEPMDEERACSSRSIGSIGATEFLVSSLDKKYTKKVRSFNKKNKNEESDGIVGFKGKAVNKKEISREPSNKLLQRKERYAVNAKF